MMSGNSDLPIRDIQEAINKDTYIAQLTDQMRQIMYQTNPAILLQPDGSFELYALDGEAAKLVENIKALMEVRIQQIISVNTKS